MDSGTPPSVIPADAGNHAPPTAAPRPGDVDPGFRRGDGGGEWLVVSGQSSGVRNPPGTWTPAFAGETGGEAWILPLSPGSRDAGFRRGSLASIGHFRGAGLLIFLSFPLIFGPVVDSRKGAPDRYHARVWSRGLGMGKCQWGAFHAEGAEITQSTQRLRFKHRDRREHREVDGGPLSTSH